MKTRSFPKYGDTIPIAKSQLGHVPVFRVMSPYFHVLDFLRFFVFALAVRLFFVFWLPGYRSEVGLDNYDAIAQALLQGRGFVDLAGQSSAYRAPLYSLFLAGIYWLAGHSPVAVWIIQCFLGAAAAALTYVLASYFVANNFARVAGLVASAYPPFILYCGMLLSETLFVFLFLLALCVLGRHPKDLSNMRAALAGILFGLASLTRPVGFFFTLGIAGFALVSGFARGNTKLLKFSAILAASFLLVLSPWAVRNAKIFGSPVWTTTEGGSSLWIGLHPDPRGFGFNNLEKLEAVLQEAGVKDEIERDRFLKGRCLKEIVARPFHFARLAISKICWFFNSFDGEDYGLATRFNLPAALVMTLALVGLVFVWRRPRFGLLVYAFFYFVFLAAVIYGIPRFRLSLEPVLIVLGVVALETIRQMPSKKCHVWASALCVFVLANVAMTLCADQAKTILKGYMKAMTGFTTRYERE